MEGEYGTSWYLNPRETRGPDVDARTILQRNIDEKFLRARKWMHTDCWRTVDEKMALWRERCAVVAEEKRVAESLLPKPPSRGTALDLLRIIHPQLIAQYRTLGSLARKEVAIVHWRGIKAQEIASRDYAEIIKNLNVVFFHVNRYSTTEAEAKPKPKVHAIDILRGIMAELHAQSQVLARSMAVASQDRTIETFKRLHLSVADLVEDVFTIFDMSNTSINQSAECGAASTIEEMNAAQRMLDVLQAGEEARVIVDDEESSDDLEQDIEEHSDEEIYSDEEEY